MGWWTQNSQGASFQEGCGVWGDGPADLVHDLVDAVVREYQADFQRPPSKAEIRAGLEFHLGARDDLPDDAPDLTQPDGPTGLPPMNYPPLTR